MEHQFVFPVLPRGFSAQFADEPIKINGMEVQFDETVSLFPAEVEVIKLSHGYRTRPGSARKSRK